MALREPVVFKIGSAPVGIFGLGPHTVVRQDASARESCGEGYVGILRHLCYSSVSIKLFLLNRRSAREMLKWNGKQRTSKGEGVGLGCGTLDRWLYPTKPPLPYQ